ncbi:MAG: Ig-like domain-containing protein, partial [Candidatus Krumholzibacteria bacterium]|nr:Ig-like domain-containing protein [Candidatus Krumholzibacteria bacterium]
MNARTLFVAFIAAVFLAAALSVHGGDRPLLRIPGDSDGDGVPDTADACPSVDASFFDRDGDGCVDDPAGARHTEYWTTDRLPFVYWICADGAPGITDGSDLAALQAAMDAWAAIPGTDFSVSYAGTTPQQDADALDRINLITFSDDTYPFPTAVLAVGISTSFTVDSTYEGTFYRPGQIVDADMIFNPLKSLRTPTSGSGTIDIQSVATHEAGHLFGISHSPVRSSTMFYVLPPGTGAATLETEDETVFLKAYGNAAALAQMNRIDGKVVDGGSGAGVPGVIVCAVSIAGGDTLASDYTLPDGSYHFVGLPDGGYYIGIHPLDGTSAIGYLEPSYINTLVDTTAVTAVVSEWWDIAESNNDDSGAKDAISLGGGQAVADIDIITNIDAVSPEIMAMTPGQSATGVLISAALKITFSEPIDYTTISGNFEVNDPSGGFVTGSVAVLNDDSILAFTPAGAYDFATDYTLTLSTGLKDRFGNGLSSPFVSTFTTQTAPPLGIQYLSPNKGVVGSKVVISGTGFSWIPEQNTVMFGAEQAPVSSAFPFRLVVTVPIGATTGLVTVTTAEGTSNGLTFTVLSQEEIARGFQSGETELYETPRMLAVMPDGNWAYVATDAGVAAVAVDPGQAGYLDVEPIPVPGGVCGLDAMPGGKLVYCAGVGSGQLHVIDTDPEHIGLFNTVIAELDCGASPLGIAIEPAGGRAFVPTGDGGIQVWDVRQGSATWHEQIGLIAVDEPSLRGGIAVDPAGERLLALTGTGRLLVYDLGPDTLLASIGV